MEPERSSAAGMTWAMDKINSYLPTATKDVTKNVLLSAGAEWRKIRRGETPQATLDKVSATETEFVSLIVERCCPRLTHVTTFEIMGEMMRMRCEPGQDVTSFLQAMYRRNIRLGPQRCLQSHAFVDILLTASPERGTVWLDNLRRTDTFCGWSDDKIRGTLDFAHLLAYAPVLQENTKKKKGGLRKPKVIKEGVSETVSPSSVRSENSQSDSDTPQAGGSSSHSSSDRTEEDSPHSSSNHRNSSLTVESSTHSSAHQEEREPRNAPEQRSTGNGAPPRNLRGNAPSQRRRARRRTLRQQAHRRHQTGGKGKTRRLAMKAEALEDALREAQRAKAKLISILRACNNAENGTVPHVAAITATTDGTAPWTHQRVQRSRRPSVPTPNERPTHGRIKVGDSYMDTDVFPDTGSSISLIGKAQAEAAKTQSRTQVIKTDQLFAPIGKTAYRAEEAVIADVEVLGPGGKGSIMRTLFYVTDLID